jgi:glycosyltransferase involved in cell wall biosynthesis
MNTHPAPPPVGPILFPFINVKLGGSHISAFTLAEALQKEFGIRCVAIAGEGTMIAQNAAQRGLEVAFTGERPRRRHNPIYDLVRLRRRLGLLRRYGRDAIIHCNDIGSLQSWGMAGKLLGQRSIYHSRSFPREVLPNRVLVRQADRVVSIGDASENAVKFVPPERRVRVTNPFAIDIESDRSSARTALVNEFGFPKDARLVGYVSNFWQRKRPDMFLEVCALLAKEDAGLRFILFGRDGDLTQDHLQLLAERLGIADRTHFAGFRMPAEDNLAALDLMVLPTLQEPFGRSLVEATLLGTPFIATDDAGTSEIFRRWGAGRVAPIEADASELARMARSVLEEPDTARLPLERRKEIASELSPRNHAARMLEVYQEVSRRL